MILNLFLLCLVVLAVFFILPEAIRFIVHPSNNQGYKPNPDSKVGYRIIKRKIRRGE